MIRDLEVWLRRRAADINGWPFLSAATREELRHKWTVEFFKERQIIGCISKIVGDDIDKEAAAADVKGGNEKG
jgi:hypothetical protein